MSKSGVSRSLCLVSAPHNQSSLTLWCILNEVNHDIHAQFMKESSKQWVEAKPV